MLTRSHVSFSTTVSDVIRIFLACARIADPYDFNDVPISGSSGHTRLTYQSVKISLGSCHLSHLTVLFRLLSSTTNLDTALLTLAYTLHLLHASLARITSARLLLATQRLVEKLTEAAPGALLPGETLIATLAPAPTSKVLRTQQSVKALAGLIDDFRVFTRLWGLLRIWAWATSLWRSPPKDWVIRTVLWTQVSANVVFQYLENCAYLASKGVLGLSDKKIARWYTWSARLWATHVLLELVRLAREAALQRDHMPLEERAEKEQKIQKTQIATKWWRDVYVNAAWMPLTIHWSMQEGFAGEGVIAAIGLVPGLLGLREAWRATA